MPATEVPTIWEFSLNVQETGIKAEGDHGIH